VSGRGRAAAAVAACALALAGCGGAGAGARPASPAQPRPGTPLQTANGPVEPGAPGARPLTLRVASTAQQVAVRFRHEPRSGLLFDLDTGAVLWQRLPTRVLPIASLTKMMTAIVVVDSQPADARVRIPKAALDVGGSKVGVLPRRRRVRLETLLNGLLLPSGNDAAVALAVHVAGSEAAFVAEMNRRAQQMGLGCTRFASSSGIVDAGNHSCAVDLAELARAVLDRPRLARIVRRPQAILPLAIKGGRVYLYSHNPLLRAGYPGTIGIKTGFTDAAGRCFVAAVQRGGRRLGVVLLHSPDPARQARRLFDRAFGSTAAAARP
jgi:serine-type D-Ala-D-Ala carboxypeptidase (penicillin-binding protein 5/6)